jgi:hypothetical protein
VDQSKDDEQLFQDMNGSFRSNNYELDVYPQNNSCEVSQASIKLEVTDPDDPEEMDIVTLRKEFYREQTEKGNYRRQYLELQEKTDHLERVSTEYEGLYVEFLQKSIETK